ncbi:hypothetical protein HPP92_002177 [Vanilla planifolia]|uniref:FYVE-type domain-containing protein n=1 Tax=Vanilla planifolia TaxID=51239 RepID=A0A835VM47_VANPL|nr:hypothetical protein HPP92_002464 [Vanilla planifolia]KAG0502105.1 hypothetical protein HPP92_002177 [Vanilla planifolia]
MPQGNEFSNQHYQHAHQFLNSNPIPNPSPTPTEFAPPNPMNPSKASAPPFSLYSSSEFTVFSSPSVTAGSVAPYPPYYWNPDPIPSMSPAAPSHCQPQLQSQTTSSQFPSHTPYGSSPLPPEQFSVPSSAWYTHLQQPSNAPYYAHDSHQNYAAPPNSNPDPGHSHNLNPTLSSIYAYAETIHDGSAQRFDHAGGYYSQNSGNYGMSGAGPYAQSRTSYDLDYFEKRPERSLPDDGFGDGVYAYDGGRMEPYGARGVIPRSSSSSPWGSFDDYGRSGNLPLSRNDQSGSPAKIVRAVPKAETLQDVKNGVQKFRVKLLPDGATLNTLDVLCQIGLDGIRMVDPSSNITLRVYPLETLTKWEVIDSSIFCIWSKSSVDVEPKRIRLKSNSYTTSTILDTVTAASVQLKEMGDSIFSRSNGSGEDSKMSEQPNEKKKGLADWMNLMKLGNEEKEHWVPDEAVSQCTSCAVAFGAFYRRHHCRNCGDIFCDKCSLGRIALTADENALPVRVCDKCLAEVIRRLNNAKETGRCAVMKSHEDLARKLQEEMDRNRKSLSGSKSSDSSGRKMREVACPTCTVHLQVQVPSSGSETVECGVCQHPFLVNAH